MSISTSSCMNSIRKLHKALVSNNAVIFFTFTAIEMFLNTLHMLPSFGQPPPTRRVKNTARYVRPSSVRRDWSDRLERTEQRPAWSRTQHRQLRSPTEDALISAVYGALSALEALCDNALYKLTSTLTLLEHSSYLSTKPVLEKCKARFVTLTYSLGLEACETFNTLPNN